MSSPTITTWVGSSPSMSVAARNPSGDGLPIALIFLPDAFSSPSR